MAMGSERHSQSNNIIKIAGHGSVGPQSSVPLNVSKQNNYRSSGRMHMN